MTDRDAMKLALEALENHEGNYKLTDAGCDRHEKTIAALREALAKQTGDIGIGTPSSQPAQQEPLDLVMITTAYEQGVGKGHQAQGQSNEIMNPYTLGACHESWSIGYINGKKQAAREKPLTDEEISNLWDGHLVPVFGKNGINPIVFARAIEAAHGIKEERHDL